MVCFVPMGGCFSRMALPMESISIPDPPSQKLFISRKERPRCRLLKCSLDPDPDKFPMPSWPVEKGGAELLPCLEQPHVLSLWIDSNLQLNVLCVCFHLLLSSVGVCISFKWRILLEKGYLRLPCWFPTSLRDYSGWNLSPEEPSSRVCKFRHYVWRQHVGYMALTPGLPSFLNPVFF